MSTSPSPRLGFLPVDDYLKLPRDPETWILKPFLPISGAALLYGDPKLGKSYLAVQLALAISGQAPDFMGFPTVRTGKVLYLQLDTPRSLWALRFEQMLIKGGLKYDSSQLLLADRESILHYPFDMLQPLHVRYLYELVQAHQPVAVILDTLRQCHSGDEDSSTISNNLVTNLVAATHPAAMVLVSHSRKPNPDADKNIMADHRGSTNIVATMDAIMRLTKNRLFYAGRAIEEGDIKVERMDTGLWRPMIDDAAPLISRVMSDTTLNSLRAKARALAPSIGKSEEATMSLLRRHLASHTAPVEVTDTTTGEVTNLVNF